MSGTHWATIATSVGGLATAGALLVSLFLLGQQMREQRRMRAERHLEHASHISFWLELSEISFWQKVTDSGLNPVMATVNVKARIENTSVQPAMQILLLVGLRTDVWRDASKNDNTKVDERGQEWSAVAIGPQSKQKQSFAIELPQSAGRLVKEYGDAAIIGELLFTDAAGVDWVKTSGGQLIERNSALWISMIPLPLSQRDAQRRQADAPRMGIRQRFLHWAISHLS